MNTFDSYSGMYMVKNKVYGLGDPMVKTAFIYTPKQKYWSTSNTNTIFTLCVNNI